MQKNSSFYISQEFTPPGLFTDGIEGPACDMDGNLYAVNYLRQGTIGKVTPGAECSVFLELPKGSVANGIRFDRHGVMFIADYMGHAIWQVNPDIRQLKRYAHEPLLHQPNDIAIRSDGMLFASDPHWAAATGRIWRIGPDKEFVLLEDHMGTTNGIEVSPEERILYVNETVQRRIWAYDLFEDGRIGGKRLFYEFPDFGLDGMRCDTAGCLYVTRHGKGCIAKISPDGRLLLEIPLSGKNCTNLTFGGQDGKTCYVTVADRGNVEYFRVETSGRCWQLNHQ